MLSDEEKAIEMIEHIQECNTLIGYGVEDRTILAKALLNLIEKQQKEIELLKEENEKYKNPPFFDEDEYTEKDKIKAKIEELKNTHNGDDFNLTNVIMILQSLLEKE